MERCLRGWENRISVENMGEKEGGDEKGKGKSLDCCMNSSTLVGEKKAGL